MKFSVVVDGPLMRCTVIADAEISAPILCCSGMAPIRVESGGKTVTSVGGYIEIQLPDLPADTPITFTLCYDDPSFFPVNRAWLPRGVYLRHADGCTALPELPAGAYSTSRQMQKPYPGLRLIPQPTDWAPCQGTFVTDGFQVFDPALLAVDALAKRNDLGPFSRTGGNLLILETDADLCADAYSLIIESGQITLRANSYGGRFYGGITLLTLMQTYMGALPCGTITDSPRFGWRGQHLDCARHFYATTTLQRLLDLMALCKLNRFHWHFADDEAFRLQIESYPQIRQQTKMRGEGCLIPGHFGGGISSGGSYSKEDAKRLIAHAATLNIEILPEIEFPAHALAFCKVFPETRDPDDSGIEISVQGYTQNVMNPAMPKTWEIITAIASEVADIFPFKHLHLGCDELPEDTWMGSPAARALMAKNELKTTLDLQGWTIERLAAELAATGVRPAAWEEAAQGCNGGIGNGALLFSWTGQGAGIAAARAGYDVVMSPAQHVYLDMACTDDPNDWGANWAAYVTLTDTINWEPIPANAVDCAANIVGVEGAFWSEFTTEDRQLWPMLTPRILGVAVKAWQDEVAMSGEELQQLAGHYASIFSKMDCG